jgi:hypothetical protein
MWQLVSSLLPCINGSANGRCTWHERRRNVMPGRLQCVQACLLTSRRSAHQTATSDGDVKLPNPTQQLVGPDVECCRQQSYLMKRYSLPPGFNIRDVCPRQSQGSAQSPL